MSAFYIFVHLKDRRFKTDVRILFVAFAAFKHDASVVSDVPIFIRQDRVLPFFIINELWVSKSFYIVAPVSPPPHNKRSGDDFLTFDNFIGIYSGYSMIEIVKVNSYLMFFLLRDKNIE